MGDGTRLSLIEVIDEDPSSFGVYLIKEKKSG